MAAEEAAELEKTQAYFTQKSYEGQPLPEPSSKKLNKEKLGKDTEDELTEWEKNLIKNLFKEYDTEKKGIERSDLV